MASKVYFISAAKAVCEHCHSNMARKLLETLLEQEQPEFGKSGFVPLKVHFGEKGNRTYLKPAVYNGVIDLLEEKGLRSAFMETSVLYGGERFIRSKHEKLAEKHGFTRLPVIIADGEKGEDSLSVPVSGTKHFQTCSVARGLAELDQILVMSHFKGHGLAGFGGAIKQLSMGFAAKGGKLAMHMNVKPEIRTWFCKRCKLCTTRCQVGAIDVTGKKPVIDHNKCIGCGACFSICPHHAISIWTWQGICNALFRKNQFREKLVEYAYAAHSGKKHVYITYALNVTGGCDCEPRPMRAAVPDIGIFASLDPVAIDAACYDAVAKAGKKFKGAEQLDYAESIGLGSKTYELIELSMD